MSSTALEAAPVRFVIARREIAVKRDGIATTIRAGAPVRADDEVVRAAPQCFFAPTTYCFHLELHEHSEDGLPLRHVHQTQVIENLPPPGPSAAEYWSGFFADRFTAQGVQVRDLSCERTGESAFTVRAELDRNPSDITVIDSFSPDDGTLSRQIMRKYWA